MHQGAGSVIFDFFGQYSLHYYAIFMHADENFSVQIVHAAFPCINERMW
jgi:hypothetical protein